MVYGPSAVPLAEMCDDTKPSIAPLFQDSCWTAQAWLVDGCACALVVVGVEVQREQVAVRVFGVRLVPDRLPGGEA